MNFQNIFLGILAVAVIAAIVIFAQGGGSNSTAKTIVKVAMWGDVDPSKGLSVAINEFNQRNSKTYNISYTFVKSDTFESKFIEAIADNKAPDLILISNSRLLRLENKLQPLSYNTLPINNFDQTYIEASKIFMSGKGLLGLPLLLDPIVLYSNHDLFTNASIISAPKYWDDIISLQPKLTKRGEVAGTFDYSAIALGEYENINYAKDIISTLFLQSGIPILNRNDKWEADVNLDSATRTTGEPPIDSAIRFYMDFSNPLKTLYSWNRTQPASFDAFIGEKLAMYIGRASDYRLLKEKNPHLNFDISQIPQMRGSSIEATYAEVIGVSVVKSSKQAQNSLIVMQALANDTTFISSWSKAELLPPARKDLLTKAQTDQVMPYLYNAAIKSRSWLDPKEDESSKSFSTMVGGLSSGKFQTPGVASSFLKQELANILSKLPQ